MKILKFLVEELNFLILNQIFIMAKGEMHENNLIRRCVVRRLQRTIIIIINFTFKVSML